MDLQDTDICCLIEQREPCLGRQFAVGLEKFDRIGTIGALQWTAMREFGQHADWREYRFGHSATRDLSDHSCRKDSTSAAISSRGDSSFTGSSSRMRATEIGRAHV